MAKRTTFGGIVINDFGYVLLRKPKDQFGGYVWTFPKRAARPGESPQETALRSVREETGVEATVEEPIREKLGNICGQPRICGSRKKGPGPWGAGALNGEALSAGAHSLQNASLGLTGQLIPASNHFCQV